MSDIPAGDYVHCPYLGKVEDRQSIYNQATRRHRCYRWERALPIKRQDQEQYCLSPLHVTCPRLSDPEALPVPEGRRRRHRRTARILGIPVQRLAGYVIPMILLFVVAVVASVVLVRRLTASPLPTVVIAIAGTPGTATATATSTRFPTWTPVPPPATETPTATATGTATLTPTPAATETPVLAPTPTLMPTPTPRVATPAGTSTFTSGLATPTPRPTSSAFTSPLETPSPSATGSGTAQAGTQSGYDFAVMGEPVKTLLPSGVDVCAKVFGRVYDSKGNIITNTVGAAVDWWPNNRIEVGTEGNPPINADGTYEFCLTRGQFNLSITAPHRTSEVLWIDLDEPAFKGQVVLEINWQLVR
ncbi:MAG: hypothetical protein ACYC5O_19015 [Anaerolineae bacterium]